MSRPLYWGAEPDPVRRDFYLYSSDQMTGERWNWYRKPSTSTCVAICSNFEARRKRGTNLTASLKRF
jgi:hypothetical protein